MPCLQFIGFQAACVDIGLEFPIKYTIEQARELWNPRALAKLTCELIPVRDGTNGESASADTFGPGAHVDYLLTTDNTDGDLFPISNLLREAYEKPHLEEGGILYTKSNFQGTGMGGTVFLGRDWTLNEMKDIINWLKLWGYTCTRYEEPI